MLNKLDCWLAKQINTTASALSTLLTDVDSIYYATLQNRTAVSLQSTYLTGLVACAGHACSNV